MPKRNSQRSSDQADQVVHNLFRPDTELGSTVRHLRKTAKVSQTELGKLLELHQAAVCRVELGEQTLTPFQLKTISEYFDISVDYLLLGRINYWKVAERFERKPPFPTRYQELPFSRVREVLPVLFYLGQSKGPGFARELLENLEIDLETLRNPDQRIGVNLNLDVLRAALASKAIDPKDLAPVAEKSLHEGVQGVLHSIFKSQSSSIALLQNWVLNHHHYEENFGYEVLDLGAKNLDLAISPKDHMKGVPYKDEVLGDILCRYKKSYFSAFPQYIGQTKMKLVEKECHFKGHKSCVYRLSA